MYRRSKNSCFVVLKGSENISCEAEFESRARSHFWRRARVLSHGKVLAHSHFFGAIHRKVDAFTFFCLPIHNFWRAIHTLAHSLERLFSAGTTCKCSSKSCTNTSYHHVLRCCRRNLSNLRQGLKMRVKTGGGSGWCDPLGSCECIL
jgi:hypothetical protein